MSSKVAMKKTMSDYKFIKDYSQWNYEKSRYETWDESVERVMNMHRSKYEDKMSDELSDLIDFAQNQYENKKVLASQRSLQFGGEPTLRKEGRMYNCLTSYCDRPKFFNEAMWWLLLGGGVGFSVQKHHIANLPSIKETSDESVIYEIPDSIEGWSDSFAVLLSSYFTENQVFPEYAGKKVVFDYSRIRPEGSLISGGFKAPGPEGLRRSLSKVRELIEDRLKDGAKNLRPIDCYDTVMHMSDAVLSGGIRRSATICLFSPDDEEMIKAKTGNWFIDNPQRGRSNNSALLIRDDTNYEKYVDLFESIKQYGEPGVVWSDSSEFVYNPCVEIGFKPVSPKSQSAWQGCNLCEINGGAMTDEEKFLDACKAASILGTLQAGFTDFGYTGPETKETFEAEALLGVSITGWMESPKFLFNEDVLKKGTDVVRKYNEIVSDLIGINRAARLTCTKPSGNASVLLGTSSGIHPHHSKRYFRHIQGNINEDVVKHFQEINPKCVEQSVWNPNGKDVVIAFPIEAPTGSKFKDELTGVELLEYVKFAQNTWVEWGTNKELCTDPRLRHNISNTITVNNWDDVRDYVWENRNHFAGISFLPPSGDKDYPQAPFTEVKSHQEISDQYGVASIFASGLVVDALNAFNGDLWVACSLVLGQNPDMESELKHATSHNALKRDWVRRAKKFSKRYFKNDLTEMSYCLKDVYLLHKWESVTRSMKEIDWTQVDIEPHYTDVSTTGAIACSGGACEI